MLDWMASAEGKLRIGSRVKAGSGPIWTTGQSGGNSCCEGIQGTSESSTSTASASASQGSTSPPACIGCVLGREFCAGQNSTTGMAKRSAKRASAAAPP